jgi:hypothetical protein
MIRWYPEDWHFQIKVLKVGKENKAEECRLGLESGDTFLCDYETWVLVLLTRWTLSARMVLCGSE